MQNNMNFILFTAVRQHHYSVSVPYISPSLPLFLKIFHWGKWGGFSVMVQYFHLFFFSLLRGSFQVAWRCIYKAAVISTLSPQPLLTPPEEDRPRRQLSSESQLPAQIQRHGVSQSCSDGHRTAHLLRAGRKHDISRYALFWFLATDKMHFSLFYFPFF